MFRTLAAAATAGLLLAGTAHAANIVTFSQTSAANTVSATVNGADTETMLTITDAAISIGQLITGAPPPNVVLDLSAHSIDAASTLGTAVIQHFSGSFCLSTGPGCTGLDVLSGTFTDAAFGALGGPGLTVNVNTPPDTLDLTSALIPADELDPPSALSLGFSNLHPDLSILGSTIGPFTAAFAGTVSASVMEPSTLLILGFGLVALGLGHRAARSRA